MRIFISLVFRIIDSFLLFVDCYIFYLRISKPSKAEKVQKAYGKLDVPWGNVFKLEYGKINLPANGGGGELEIFCVVDFAPLEDGSFKSVGGDSYIAAVEFSNPVRAMSLNSYGNSTQPNSPHVGDRLKFAAQKKLHPVWRSRQEIMAHLEEHQVF